MIVFSAARIIGGLWSAGHETTAERPWLVVLLIFVSAVALWLGIRHLQARMGDDRGRG